MKVSVELSKEYNPPHAVIYTDTVTDEIQKTIDLLGIKGTPLIAQREDRMEVLKPDEVYMKLLISLEQALCKYPSRPQ